ncbi:ARM repeat superfamily protein [Striga asiatica]|uniref:ARM repeat superfamily protein n=1 Tax=Striga asiatica TaxID=4170 RepID=A0A5A7QIF5_STRAF|nr:ARM repeat superfamily protein [Striga asiatica]
MNRIVKRVFSTAVASYLKPSRGLSVLLQNENPRALMKFQQLCRRNPVNVQSRKFSSSFLRKDEKSIEEEAERKIGWLLKTIFFGTAGENLMQQSVSLLHVKDPLFKRMGASRLARFAIDDERRMKIVEMGGAKQLVSMLTGAKDDRTREAALKALVAISKSDNAVGALHEAGAITVIRSTPDSTENNEIGKYKSNLLKIFQDLGYDISS